MSIFPYEVLAKEGQAGVSLCFKNPPPPPPSVKLKSTQPIISAGFVKQIPTKVVPSPLTDTAICIWFVSANELGTNIERNNETKEVIAQRLMFMLSD